ncbi:MAG: hypothetical protein L6R42_005742 [Xanthoria sp. 1 TBL-2021]|nr:MAG: hypothetical protein L6R42_005742 [Xanthoria sp. 1 TBL-2021]
MTRYPGSIHPIDYWNHSGYGDYPIDISSYHQDDYRFFLDEIYPEDSASNHGVEDRKVQELQHVNGVRRPEADDGIAEYLANVHQMNPHAPVSGRATQGVCWDGRAKCHGDRNLLFQLSRFKVRTDWGSQYPCSEEKLWSYQRLPKQNKRIPLSEEMATGNLVGFLNQPILPGSKEDAAIHRLANGMRLWEWGPDIVIKAFDDLDIVFFRGVLDTRIQIEWRSDEEIIGKRTGDRVLGLCIRLGHGRSRIVLNATRILLHAADPSSTMWATALHEMVHGYLDVLCDETHPSPIDNAMGEAWSVGGHGQSFRRIITAIDDRFRKYFNMSAISAGESFRLVPCGSNHQLEDKHDM